MIFGYDIKTCIYFTPGEMHCGRPRFLRKAMRLSALKLMNGSTFFPVLKCDHLNFLGRYLPFHARVYERVESLQSALCVHILAKLLHDEAVRSSFGGGTIPTPNVRDSIAPSARHVNNNSTSSPSV